MGGAYLVTWTMLCFQFHTHQSLQHSKASHYFQTVAELHLSIHNLCPSKSHLFVQIEIDASEHAQIFTAQRYSFRNWSFNICGPQCVWSIVNVRGPWLVWPIVILHGPLLVWTIINIYGPQCMCGPLLTSVVHSVCVCTIVNICGSQCVCVDHC